MVAACKRLWRRARRAPSWQEEQSRIRREKKSRKQKQKTIARKDKRAQQVGGGFFRVSQSSWHIAGNIAAWYAEEFGLIGAM